MTNTETVTLSKMEYEALLQEKEDLGDLVAAIEADREGGYIPHEVVLATLDGENMIRAFRNYKGLSLRGLARRAGLSAGYLSQIETGSRVGSAAVLVRVANALETTVDALIVDHE